MRAPSATLLAAQKAPSYDFIVKIVLTNNGTTHTYTETRILDIDRTEVDDRQSALVILDNKDQVVSALDLRGFKAVISQGATTSEGDEYSAFPPLYVIGQQSHSWGGLAVSLSLAGIPNLMAEDEANVAYKPASDDTDTVKTLMRKIAGDSGVSILGCFDHCHSYDIDFDSEDDLIDSFIPADAFAINFKDRRWNKLNEVLKYTKCVMRVEDDGKIHVFAPVISTSTSWQANTDYVVGDTVIPTTPNEVEYKCTTAGKSHASTEPTWANALEVGDTIADGTVVWTVSYDYDYRLEDTYHTFFSETYRKRAVIPGYIEVESLKSQDPSYTGNASDGYYSTLPTNLQLREHKRLRVTSNAQCTKIATAILSHYQAAAERGSGIVPMNVGAEVHDFVKVKDTRLDDYRVGNIGYIRWHYTAGKTPTMEFRFGKLGFGLAGTGLPGVGGVFDPNQIWEILTSLEASINNIIAYLDSKPWTDVLSLDIYDKEGNYLGTLGGMTNTLFLYAAAAAANLELASTSATAGVTIAAGQTPSTPDAGTLLLQAGVAIKIDPDDSFIIPVL